MFNFTCSQMVYLTKSVFWGMNQDYNMKLQLFIIVLLVNLLGLDYALHIQLIQSEQNGKLKNSNYIDFNLPSNINNICEARTQFGIIKCNSGSINLTLESVIKVNCSYIIVDQHLMTVIVRDKEIQGQFITKFPLLSLHYHYKSSICYCNNTTHNNASIVVICWMFHQYQKAYFVCGCDNTMCINASKVTSDHRNTFNISIFCPKTRPLAHRVKRTQEDNTSLRCGLGFKAFSNECKCDPKLISALPNIQCVNSQLLRPPMTWIGCEKNCTQILYSKNCFVDYCLLTDSYLELNVSIIDTQCNYGRTGRLCGHCHKGYDSVFGSQAKCKKCSNIWLSLIPVFGAAGFLLVIVLFLLDLTVTKGLINGFVLYINVIGMENVIIFPLHHKFLPVLVDMSNLNLGVEACFYRGMTEFDKQWLQLVFLFYLISIVGFIVIASRYSVRVEKLTRKRVIPVLATLLFLSYNKLLLTTTTVLFYYQPIYDLETNKYELFWPVDTSVKVFAPKFILLFVICLLIFVIFLIPINVILLFPTYCFKFRKVVYFKPFIDAFQAPYKDKVRYTIGIELLIRTIAYVFNAMYFVDYYQKFGVNVVIFLLYFSYLTMIQPYKVFYKTVLHWSFILNLGFILALQIYSLSSASKSSYIVFLHIVVLAAYLEFAGIVIYESCKFINHSKVLRNFVSKYIIKKAKSQQEIIQDIENPLAPEFQEELLGID